MCSNCTCQTNREARCCVWIKTCLLCYDWLSLLCHTCKHDIPCGVKSFLILLFWDGDCNSLHRSVKRGVVWKCEWCSLDVCYYMFKTVFCRKREDKIIKKILCVARISCSWFKKNKQTKETEIARWIFSFNICNVAKRMPTAAKWQTPRYNRSGNVFWYLTPFYNFANHLTLTVLYIRP